MLSSLQAFLSSFGVCYCNTSWSEWNFITKYVWETGWHIACTWSVCWTSRSQWSQGLRHMARSTCVVFFGKTLYSQSAFPHPEVKMGTCKLPGKPDWMLPPGGSSDTLNQFMLRNFYLNQLWLDGPLV